ncbi:hypothetical protein O9G_002152 [Rozella allomycis CSF55]|uniref:Uncharacterized protein n=1 Tax=Rozella allomycis (strain CSF55) TaxID=988480 RepID=A0A075AQ02_ROZAC|nr:hypothetical protein O9G_002152 [Rozella allomycis CSF55]|eukprot:EPZ32311.1 hypothetical protein O9G_002152 [Rozella allomycis CSF55]
MSQPEDTVNPSEELKKFKLKAKIKIQQLQQTVDTLTKENEDLKLSCEESNVRQQEEINKLSNLLKNSEEVVKIMSREKDDLSMRFQENRDLQERLESKDKAVKRLSEEMENANNKIRENNEFIQKLQRVSCTNDKNELFESLKKVFEENKKLNQLEDVCASKVGEIENLKNQVKSLSQDLSAVNYFILSFKDYKQKEDEANELKSLINDLKNQMSVKDEEIESQKAQISSLEIKIKQLEIETESVIIDKKDISFVEEELNKLKILLNEKESEIILLNEKIQKSEHENANLILSNKKQSENLSSKLFSLENQKSELEKQISELNEKFAQQKQSNAVLDQDYRSKIINLQQKLHQLETTAQHQTSFINPNPDLLQRISQLESLNNQLQREVNDYKLLYQNQKRTSSVSMDLIESQNLEEKIK